MKGKGQTTIMDKHVPNILIIDDEESVCSILKRFLSFEGYNVTTKNRATEGLKFINENRVDLLIVDLMMPGMTGLELITKLKDYENKPEIIVVSGHGTINSAVDAIKLGAYDFIEKPLHLESLKIDVNNALLKGNLSTRVKFLETRLKGDVAFSSLIGKNKGFQNAIILAKQVANSDVNLLISGESGTGKEVFAKAVHAASNRCKGPFIALNCAAIPENLLESELFGYEKGSFTGANSRHIGHFENATKGTIFLDEVGELPISLQAKILRVVQEKKVLRLGNSTSVDVDCRIISATNRNLKQEITNNKFREDLYFRLNVIELNIPSLRERLDDIPLLIKHFLTKFNEENIRIENVTLDVLQKYNWPGNIRELENIIQRAIVLSNDKIISNNILPKHIIDYANFIELDKTYDSSSGENDYKTFMGKCEKKYIVESLELNGGNVIKSAVYMGIARQTLYRLMNKHDISSQDYHQ